MNGDSGHDPELSLEQEVEILRNKDRENMEIIRRLRSDLDTLHPTGQPGQFLSGEQILSKSPGHADSPVVVQLKSQVRDLEREREELIQKKRDVEAKYDLEIQTNNAEKKKMTRQITEWKDWCVDLTIFELFLFQ